MKDRLVTIFNAMNGIETKGESTLIMADCLRELANVINSIPPEESEEPNEVGD